MFRRVASWVVRALYRSAELLEQQIIEAPKRTFDDELADELAEFDTYQQPISDEAAAMIARPERDEPKVDVPLAGSIEARLAKAREW